MNRDDRLPVTEPAQFKALGHPVRWRILGLLGAERDATITQLAQALERSKGSVGYHVGVLADAGLIDLSRTRPVRGVVEKYWRRSASGYELAPANGESGAALILNAVLGELREGPEEETETLSVRRVTMSRRAALELKAELERLSERIDEIRVEGPGSGAVGTPDGGQGDDEVIDVGVLLGIYRPAGRPLPPDLPDPPDPSEGADGAAGPVGGVGR